MIVSIIFNATIALSEDLTYDKDAHHAVARRVAERGIVLLKYEDQRREHESTCLSIRSPLNFSLSARETPI